ncbi:VOC family protein [Dermatobacter hominis]|uniref:VOC family protein n=1 Tax=Dermatobacter hominis TaxID=2884263 RepID=UPI001D110793|nr:VOC family protein [Dermatobacter hominis]UDY37580.1 VOC family protein [Dermatobacter hominis]
MLDGFNHVAILTGDLERLEGFYRDVFDVADVRRMDDHGLRHCLLRVGSSSVLHAFEQDAPAPGPIFRRGRVDHLALNVAERDEFDRLRRRLVDVGASTGDVTDFGVLLSVTFEDPDGMFCELCWMRDGATLADATDSA